jgi:hypothetical protein
MRKADNLTAIPEQFVCTMWDPGRFLTPWNSTECYKKSFTFNLQRLEGCVVLGSPLWSSGQSTVLPVRYELNLYVLCRRK